VENFESFRRQEIALIKLSLGVIAALSFVHLAFAPTLGYPRILAFILLSARFSEQSVEWHLLRRRKAPLSPALIRLYCWASPLAAILFAFVMTVVSDMEDAHYHVLMVIPIIASAFRFRLRWVLVFMTVAAVLTVLAVLIFNGDDNVDGIRELFEAMTDVLVYFVVGIVVWMMSEHLRRDSDQLRQHYDQLKTMQARLLKDERLAAVGRLASAIAHEIRNPVAAISSSLAAADTESMPANIRREMSRIAAREAGRLEKLTSDFLSYARVKSLDLRPTDVADLVKYVADLVSAKAREASVALNIRCDGDVRTMIDDFQVHGALLNLAMNAIEGSPCGAFVEIGVCMRDADTEKSIVEMYVENGGNAIPVEVANQIFEPFFTTKGSGTGLGLAIARNVAIAHGGMLELTENREGKIRFTLAVPFRACSIAIANASTSGLRSAESSSLDDTFAMSSERI
jgi:two-component system sensor histidine kinase HydH